MTPKKPNPIPYIKLQSTNGQRNCGAASLSMVYASLGLDVKQEDIWPAISKPNRFGVVSSTTHLMAQDAIERGFDAIVIQAVHPLLVLRVCLEQGVRVIINHRVSPDSPAGHYSVLAGIEKSDILIHDPVAGPNRRLDFAQLLEIWRAGRPAGEIVGNVLIAIAPRVSDIERDKPGDVHCKQCKLPIPVEVACPNCQEPVTLRPVAALGCVAESCADRMWSALCCPACDCLWTFHAKPDGSKSAAEPKPEKPLGPDVDELYKRVDNFVNEILKHPAAAANEDIRKQIDTMYSLKETLRMALAESAESRRLREDQLLAMTENAQKSYAVHRKKAEEAASQSAPLDGDALGMALLRNLGFVR